jgi:hypothetical protein
MPRTGFLIMGVSGLLKTPVEKPLAQKVGSDF